MTACPLLDHHRIHADRVRLVVLASEPAPDLAVSEQLRRYVRECHRTGRGRSSTRDDDRAETLVLGGFVSVLYRGVPGSGSIPATHLVRLKGHCARPVVDDGVVCRNGVRRIALNGPDGHLIAGINNRYLLHFHAGYRVERRVFPRGAL